MWKIPGSHTKQSVQNCTSSLSYECFSYKWPQALLLSSWELMTLPFVCKCDWRRMSCLFVCPVHSQLRDKFPLPLYRCLPEKECYCRLCSDSDDNMLLNVSQFITFASELKESLIEKRANFCVSWNAYGSIKLLLFVVVNTCCLECFLLLISTDCEFTTPLAL